MCDVWSPLAEKLLRQVGHNVGILTYFYQNQICGLVGRIYEDFINHTTAAIITIAVTCDIMNGHSSHFCFVPCRIICIDTEVMLFDQKANTKREHKI